MFLLSNLIIFFPILLLLHCVFIISFKKWIGPIGTFYSSILIFFISILLNINELYFFLINGNYAYIDFGRWFFCLDLIDSHLTFCIDGLALISSLLVLILTSLALYFGIEYMYRDAFINRLLYLLNLFATSVIFLFFCYDFFLIIIAWECIGLFSLLLVNFYSMRIYTIKAALKTFIFSRISDMFMFISFILTIIIFNTTDLSLIFLQIPFLTFHYLFIGNTAIHFLTFFSFCLVTSGVIKAAQFFFHVWLPDAMEAPTPASALIHSSTLVVAGIYLIIRFSILFEFTIFTNYYLALLGAVTLAFGSITAIFQNDIKKLVAYSTISQIGYLVCGCGFCCYEEVLIYLIIHALNKAFLFILVGYLVHFFNGNTDMRQMGGIYLYSFDISVLLFGVCFNLAGLPYSAGFLGKEFLLFQVLRDDFLSLIVRACWLTSFFFTPIYMFTLIFIVIYGPKKGVLTTYLNLWNINYHTFNQLLVNFLNKNITTANFNKFILYRFQFTLITCRTTIYVLFIFWCFFYFCGEHLLLIIFNYSTLSDVINSNFFNYFKFHTFLSLNMLNMFLTETINFFLYFFLFCAMIFLINLKFSFNYHYLVNLWLLDLIFLIFIVSLLTKYYFFILILLYIYNKIK
uniref:NADH dehydrogenase subunit 5 n=1 Tax=Pseudourostyla cristata TaxID=293816 RepID=A0A4P9JME6_9SPIT|nr:NADH dehydrogenase subunit 5 [Pseudourostyla cristata]